jgi:iron complex transport system substrate-binding protein
VVFRKFLIVGWIIQPNLLGTKRMRNKNIIYIVTALIIIIVLSGAFFYVNYKTSKADTQGNISVVDDEGYTTNLTAVPQRIISLAPACTQILFAIGDGNKVVGVTDYDNYPYNFTAWIAAGNMTSIGGYSTPNMEAIASLRPDLIVSDNINDALLPNMRSLGYKVIVINPTSINGIYQDITMVGKATGAQTQATNVIANITKTINNIEAKITAANITTKPKVYYEVWSDPLMSAGSTTWINDVISKAGGVNIFANVTQQYPQVASETIVSLNPDVILLPTNMGTGTPFYGTVQDVKSTPGWNTISAVKTDRVYVIDQDLFAEPGPRVADQVYSVAECLYPQLFNSTS